jgi:hypothetical protein
VENEKKDRKTIEKEKKDKRLKDFFRKLREAK